MVIINVGAFSESTSAIIYYTLQVLLLDADSQPLRQPDAFFELEEYKKHGNVFWADYWTANSAAEVGRYVLITDCIVNLGYTNTASRICQTKHV